MARLLTALATVLLAEVALAVPVAPPPREVAYYFPTQAGAKWAYTTYVSVDGVERSSHEWEIRVQSVVHQGDGAYAVRVESVTNGKAELYQTVEVSPRGLAVAKGETTAFGVPLGLLRLPLREGTKWEVSHAVGPKGQQLRWLATDRGTEQVTLPSGERVPALHVESLAVNDGTTYQLSAWYVARVGLVHKVDSRMKWGSSISFETVLKSFTPGKD